MQQLQYNFVDKWQQIHAHVNRAYCHALERDDRAWVRQFEYHDKWALKTIIAEFEVAREMPIALHDMARRLRTMATAFPERETWYRLASFDADEAADEIAKRAREFVMKAGEN